MPDRLIPFEWRCRKCRYEEWVRIRAPVSNVQNTERSPDAEGADQQDAWRSARMKLALRPCPKCGATDSKTIVQVIAVNALSALILPLPVTGYIALRIGAMGFNPLWWGLICVVFAACVVATRWFTQWCFWRRDIVPGLNEPTSTT